MTLQVPFISPSVDLFFQAGTRIGFYPVTAEGTGKSLDPFRGVCEGPQWGSLSAAHR